MINRAFAYTIFLASVSVSCVAHAGNIFSDAMKILDSVNTHTLSTSQINHEERVPSLNNNTGSQPISRAVSLSPYQKQVAKEFKDNLKWMYDENMTYPQLASGSPEKKVIDFVIDKVASSVAQCNGKYFIQVIQGSSLVASTTKAGSIFEITDPLYRGSTRYNQLSKADKLNGKEYSGAVFLEIVNTASKANGSNGKWQNGSVSSRQYSIELIDGRFIDATAFSENHLQNLEQYQPLQCSDIR